MKTGWVAVAVMAAALLAGAALAAGREPAKPAVAGAKSVAAEKGVERVTKTDAEWRKILTPEQYRVLRKAGTEMAFTGAYWNNHAKGTYVCAACGLELFSSEQKFESGTGWPSYWAPIARSHVQVATDNSLGMTRDEVECARCGGHLGHVFDDGPAPTGLRYCINSVSLKFVPAK